jgi:phage shock protein PspC (stress-responsive transcriptional regulator)
MGPALAGAATRVVRWCVVPGTRGGAAKTFEADAEVVRIVRGALCAP